ncbi:MAG: radical SAM protein [Verrucomicrobia bacterium]|nr:radical SAM protein [Verrucomicrobiota bacterium]
MNAACTYLSHLLRPDSRAWRPLLGVYYLTYACDFRCPYCSDGSGTPYYRLRSPVLSAERVLALFGIIRRHCDYLVITGGEPLQHPEYAEILHRLPARRFRGVILTTNGYHLDQALPAVARSVTELVVSLQTMDSTKADLEYGHPGAHQRILANLERAASHPGRKYQIIISSVATPENLADLRGVCQFAGSCGFRLAVCPQLVGVKAHHALENNPDYRGFFNFLIAAKQQGASIQGTVDYLEYLRDLKKFRCRPFTMLVVAPTGEVFYPCLELGHFAGNLLAEPNLHRIRQMGCQRFGSQPDCGTQCHSACALGFARILAKPLSILHEGCLRARTSIMPGGHLSIMQRATGKVAPTRQHP